MTRPFGPRAATRGGHRPPLLHGAARHAPVVVALCGLTGPGWALTQPVVVYRCEEATVLYTDALTPQQARQRGCTAIDPVPLTVGQTRPDPVRAGLSASQPAGTGQPPVAKSTHLTPEARAREQQALRILQAEWTREQQALATLQNQLAAAGAGTPLEPAAQAKHQQAISRKLADLQALQREIARRQGVLGP